MRPKVWVCLRGEKEPPPHTPMGVSACMAIQRERGLGFIKDSSAFLYLPKGERSPSENENGCPSQPKLEVAGVPREERKIN